MENKVKLYSIYTDEVIELKDNFLNTIKDDWDVNLKYLGSLDDGDGDFATKGWYDIAKEKIKFIIEKIKENWGNIIIWSDIDVQFFNKSSSIIFNSIVDKDIVFQAENWSSEEVNTGFCVIRCNTNTLLLYNLIMQYQLEDFDFADQSATNILLLNNKINIKWGVLPRQFWAMSHSTSPPQDIVLHHANQTPPIMYGMEKVGSIEQKIVQMKVVQNYVLEMKKINY